MTDIVERLRAAGKSAYDPYHVLMQEAADEIESLRAEIETMKFLLSEGD